MTINLLGLRIKFLSVLALLNFPKTAKECKKNMGIKLALLKEKKSNLCVFCAISVYAHPKSYKFIRKHTAVHSYTLALKMVRQLSKKGHEEIPSMFTMTLSR